MAIRFHLPRERPYGCFSNYSGHGFTLDGSWWPTAEHYFQAQKFTDSELIERVRSAPTPGDAKKIGNNRALPIRSDWDQIKDEVMRRAVEAKFAAHRKLRDLLLSTGDEQIVENAPNDPYWGCGPDGKGLNRLGQMLMEVRERLRRRN